MRSVVLTTFGIQWDFHQTLKSLFYVTGHLLHTCSSFVFAASLPALAESVTPDLGAPDGEQRKH